MKYPWKILCLLLCTIVLAGCTLSGGPAVSANSTDGIDEAAPSERDRISYYIHKLPDRDYVETYGDENPRPWYSAAEALGQIGKPAVPALIKRLNTSDPYELKLALYALMLASQDPALQAETNGDYLRLGTVLTEDSNAENRQRAFEWWERYQHLWP